jgi:hypothetical protein
MQTGAAVQKSRVMQNKGNRSNAPEMEKDQTPMLWGSNAMQQSSITP